MSAEIMICGHGKLNLRPSDYDLPTCKNYSGVNIIQYYFKPYFFFIRSGRAWSCCHEIIYEIMTGKSNPNGSRPTLFPTRQVGRN